MQFVPENIESLKNRFSKSLEAVYSVKQAMLNLETRPGNKREHVFDFEDGIRLIISRDRHKEKEYIHFSGSIDEKFFKGIADASLLKKFVDHFEELFGQESQPKLIAMSEYGIPHWVVDYIPYTLN